MENSYRVIHRTCHYAVCAAAPVNAPYAVVVGVGYRFERCVWHLDGRGSEKGEGGGEEVWSEEVRGRVLKWEEEKNKVIFGSQSKLFHRGQ